MIRCVIRTSACIVLIVIFKGLLDIIVYIKPIYVCIIGEPEGNLENLHLERHHEDLKKGPYAFQIKMYMHVFSTANLALAGFPVTNALGESMPSRL